MKHRTPTEAETRQAIIDLFDRRPADVALTIAKRWIAAWEDASRPSLALAMRDQAALITGRTIFTL